jgi:F-type H+-transporting ATPase subunit gamma
MGEVGTVKVAYNQFNSAISFTSKVKQLLPMSLDNEEKKVLEEKFPFDFKYDPSPRSILDTLIPEAFSTTLYTCLLDGIASEHGSRMAAMDNAVTNCKEAIRSQTLKMNKLRQAAITTELIEVVSGAESLNG